MTYSGNPSSSQRDQVRFLLQDTSPEQLTDAEIDHLLAQWADAYQAARNGALVLSARYAESAGQSKSIGDISLSEAASAKAEGYALLADQLAAAGVRNAGVTIYTNPDAILPGAFTTGQFENG